MHIHRDLNYIIIIKSTRVNKPQNHRNKSIKRIKNNIERERERENFSGRFSVHYFSIEAYFKSLQK